MPFQLKIAGDGPLEEELTKQIESLKLEKSCQLLGPKSQTEIIELLGQSTLFALPCVTEADGGKDNLPTVIMEAMAASVACVSTRLAGVPEMIVENETGLLVEERDPEAFAGIMQKVLEDESLRERFAKAGETRANTIFDKEVTALSFLKFLAASGLVHFDPKLGITGAFTKQLLTQRIPRLFQFRSKPKEEEYRVSPIPK